MGKDVYIAVGHGRRPDGKFDPGARGTDGRYEHHENHEVVAECVEALIRSGVTLDSEDHGSAGPEDPNYAGSINRVNAGDYRCCVEIHFDWSKGNPEPVVLHSGSSGGTELAGKIEQGFVTEGFDRASSCKDSDYGRKIRLAWVRRTNPPAALVECGIVKDYPRAVNEKMGEAIARGICDFLGVPFVAEKTHDYAVAVVGQGESDSILAYLLGAAHQFKVLRAEQVDHTDVGYLVKVGGPAARRFVANDGLEIVGEGRFETAQMVLAKIRGEKPDRARPWAQ